MPEQYQSNISAIKGQSKEPQATPQSFTFLGIPLNDSSRILQGFFKDSSRILQEFSSQLFNNGSQTEKSSKSFIRPLVPVQF